MKGASADVPTVQADADIFGVLYTLRVMEMIIPKVEDLHKDASKPKRQSRKHKRILELAKQIESYDLLGDLGNVALTTCKKLIALFT